MIEINLRNTARNYFAVCPEKYRIAVHEQLQPKVRKDYFDVGSLYHEAKKVFLHPIHAQQDLHTKLDLATKSIRKMADKQKIDTPISGLALDLLAAYVRKFPTEKEFTVIGVEQQLSCALFEPTSENLSAIYGTTLDFIARTANGRLAIGEHKTTAGHGAVYSSSIKRSPQISGSAWCAQQIFKEPVELAIINYAVKTKTPRIERDTVLLNQHRIELWLEATIAIVEEIEWFINRQGIDKPWKRNDYECWNVRYECDYTPLCWHGWNPTTLALYEKRPIGAPTQALSV